MDAVYLSIHYFPNILKSNRLLHHMNLLIYHIHHTAVLNDCQADLTTMILDIFNDVFYTIACLLKNIFRANMYHQMHQL